MNNLSMAVVICRLIVAGIATAGAVYLADQGKSFGWLIFLAVMLGCVTVKEVKES